MVVDIHGTVYLPNETPEKMPMVNENIEDIQRAHGSLSIPKTRKKLKNPSNWKRRASKTARLKGSPYRSTVTKKKPEVDGRKLKPPCSCKSKCYEKISEEKRLIIFNQFWKKCDTWDQRRQFIARSVTKKTKAHDEN